MELGPVREMNAPAADVPCGYRPNLAAVLPGKDTSRTFWIISHIDVVPPGDASLWDEDPYTLVRDGDTLIGRGVEDNHQGMVSSLLLARALKDLNVTPPMNLGLLLVADEETGSHFGLEYVVREHADLFGEKDLFLVPDFGTPDAETVEIAEKSMCWIKVVVTGKQCHASTPHEGVNALVAASDLIMRARALYEIFNDTNPLFDPSGSTFEPTKKEANVQNINTLPGRDVFHFDCRCFLTTTWKTFSANCGAWPTKPKRPSECASRSTRCSGNKPLRKPGRQRNRASRHERDPHCLRLQSPPRGHRRRNRGRHPAPTGTRRRGLVQTEPPGPPAQRAQLHRKHPGRRQGHGRRSAGLELR